MGHILRMSSQITISHCLQMPEGPNANQSIINCGHGEPGWSTPTAIANQCVSLINADWEAARDSLFLANSFRHSLEICELAYMGTQPACFVESGKSEGHRKGAGELDVANGISFPTQTLPRAWLSFLFQEIPCLLIKKHLFFAQLDTWNHITIEQITWISNLEDKTWIGRNFTEDKVIMDCFAKYTNYF